MKKVKSCQSLKGMVVDEVELSSQRKRRSVRPQRKEEVIEEEKEQERESQSCISQSLSNDRVYLKKIIKGEMLSSHPNDLGLITPSAPRDAICILEI